ncbi:MAG: NfeD family protein [Acetobacterium sp.]
MNMPLIWLILFIVFLAAEVISTGNLIFIWFCIGALVALVTAYIGGDFLLQNMLFFAVAMVLLIGTKPFVKKHMRPRKLIAKTNRLLLKRGIVVEEVNNMKGQGSVKLDGKIYSARNSENDADILPGNEIIVTGCDGHTVMVKPLEKIVKDSK